MENILDYCTISGESVKKYEGRKRYVATGDVIENKIINSSEVDYMNKPSRANQIAKVGDLLFAKMKETKKVIKIDEDNSKNIYSTGFFVIRPNEGILTDYIYWVLNSPKFNRDKDRNCKGATQKALNNEGLKKIKINKIPDIVKQQKIVSKLNKINKIITKKKKQLNMLDELIKSQFVEMFGNPIINDKKFEFKQIGEVTKIVTGTTPDTNDVENWNGGINWITPAEIKEDTLYVYETERKITEKGQKSKSLTLMPKGTVIFSTRAPIGKTAIAGTEMCCNQGFKNCICSININNIYLYYVLKNNTIYFNNLGTGATFKELSKRVFEKIKIAVPPIDLQNQFSEIVKQIDKQKFESMIQLKMMEKIYNIINDRRRYV